MKQLVWTQEAIEDREAIYDYIAVDNQAQRWLWMNCFRPRPLI